MAFWFQLGDDSEVVAGLDAVSFVKLAGAKRF